MTDTSVPFPTFGDNGFVAPSEAAILAGVQADIDGAFGGGLNQALETPQGQLASSQTAITGDSFAMFLWFCNQVDPAYSSGRMQDGIARIYFIERFAGRPTAVTCTCSGLERTIIPVGALARATDGRIYVCAERGEIPVSGSIDLTFQCAEDGPIPCAAGTLNTIYQTIFGWDSVTNAADGVLGRNVETRSEFEERRGLSTGWLSMGPLGAILGGVLSVENVLDAVAVENDEPTSTVKGGVILGPNSLYIAVVGGDNQEIAEAIWSRKMPGCGYNGNTSVEVEDPNPQYNPPPPSYLVEFQRPAVAEFVMVVTLSYNSTIPDDALSQIQTAIITAFAGADGGTRAKIGSTVYASRYYSTILALGSWAQQIVSIKVGLKGSGANITGSITGTILTVTAVTGTDPVQVGDLIQDDSALVESGTYIVSLGTGTGGVGTYNVSHTQTVASEAMFTSRLVDDVSTTLNQAPAISADDIALTTQ